MSNVLVVYFSRSGHTRKAAEAVASALDADLEPLLEPRSRRGFAGYLRSAWESLAERTSELLPVEHDVSEYELVVVGTPVWNHSVSTPIRTFLREHGAKIRRVAFFVTEGSSGAERVFRQMEQLLPCKPEAELTLLAREIDHGLHVIRVERFAERLPLSSRRIAALPGAPAQPQP